MLYGQGVDSDSSVWLELSLISELYSPYLNWKNIPSCINHRDIGN
ncbi:hypothetical protein XBP1_2230019 [Xenorhabdus bovienii str. puntauvense]|uniref:Uncharacterized protein n=1 Tax=Xenorhabdus bovienii str. puntauvense TaxID=1398201 RepID=A0A077NED9_XENBV|nr:hypothetical protein XBP1_2230019 [Xenorhabdus bovienii str. puntauvense]